MNSRYKADIGGGALMVDESRIIAELLLNDVNQEEWKAAILDQNLLQKRSQGTALRQASLIKSRLKTMTPEMWELIRDGSRRTATHGIFACAIKHSPLLGDFLDLMVRDQFRLFKTELPRKLWNRYLEECYSRDPKMPDWEDSTASKLGDQVYRALAEAGYLYDTRKLLLQSVRISGEILEYLRGHNEGYALRCIEVSG